MIRLEHITAAYGSLNALEDVSLHVREGEFFTLLGPSGCGKTTTLRTLAGFLTPASGRVFLRGQDVTAVPVEKRGVGLVFQQYALFPTMDVYGNIAFGLRVRHLPRAEIDARVRSAAARVDLSEAQLHRSIAALSGGQQQRVAIARALVTEPAILCLDEPLASLDAVLRTELRAELKALQRSCGITTLYVTHDREEALSISDRIAVLRGGRIEQVGTPDELYAHAANEFVHLFLGESNRISPALADALRARGVPLGTDDRCYVRPERVLLGQESGPLRFSGRVAASEYGGAFVKYTVDVGAQQLTALVHGGVRCAVGEEVTLSLDPVDLLRFAPDGAARC